MTPAPAEATQTGTPGRATPAAAPPGRTAREDHPVAGEVATSLASPATPSMTPSAWQVTLPGEPASVPAARRFTGKALTGCPRLDDLTTAVTELAANAVNWSAARDNGTFTVTIRTSPGRARVEITDPGPAATRPAPGATAHSNGWGLPIVAAVTDRHGTIYGPGVTRTTWAEATWSLTAPAPEPRDGRGPAPSPAEPGTTALPTPEELP